MPCCDRLEAERHRPVLPRELRGTRVVAVTVPHGSTARRAAPGRAAVAARRAGRCGRARAANHHPARGHRNCGPATASRSWRRRMPSPTSMRTWPPSPGRPGANHRRTGKDPGMPSRRSAASDPDLRRWEFSLPPRPSSRRSQRLTPPWRASAPGDAVAEPALQHRLPVSEQDRIGGAEEVNLRGGHRDQLLEGRRRQNEASGMPDLFRIKPLDQPARPPGDAGNDHGGAQRVRAVVYEVDEQPAAEVGACPP